MSEIVGLTLLAFAVFMAISWVLFLLVDRITATPGPGQARWLKNRKIRWLLIVLFAIALMVTSAVVVIVRIGGGF